MHANALDTRQHAGGHGSYGARQAIGDLSRTGHLGDEPLAQRADEHGHAEFAKLTGPPQQREVVLRGFAEADARIDDDPLARNARDGCRRHPLGQE